MGLSRSKCRFLAKRRNESNERTFPSQTSIREYLKVFHDESQEVDEWKELLVQLSKLPVRSKIISVFLN